jgi:hypothetical protein
MDDPRGAAVAVVIRSVGDPGRLEHALASVRGQDHRELVVVLALPDDLDAGSVRQLAEIAPDARVVRGAGRGALANAALAAVVADLVVLHDDDGSWDPTFLTRTVAFLAAHPDHVAVATRAEVVRAGAGPAGREVIASHEPVVSLTSLLAHNYVPPVSLLFRRSAAEAVGRYDAELPALEDWEFLLRLVAHGPVGFLPEVPLAAWHAGPPADGTEQRAAELLVRDRVLRRDLTGKEPGTSGMGLLLAMGDLFSAMADRWGHAHQDHLDVVATQTRLELSRMRGEMLLMRELLTELQEDVAVLGAQVEDAMATADGPLPAPGNGPKRARAGFGRRVANRLRRAPSI